MTETRFSGAWIELLEKCVRDSQESQIACAQAICQACVGADSILTTRAD
jgi:hypothetical protein